MELNSKNNQFEPLFSSLFSPTGDNIMDWVEVHVNFEATGEHAPLNKKFHIPNDIWLSIRKPNKTTAAIGNKKLISKKYTGIETTAIALAEYLGMKPTRVKKVLLSEIIEVVDKNGEIGYYMLNEMGSVIQVERW